MGEEGLCPPRRVGGDRPRHAVGSTETNVEGATPALCCLLARRVVCTLPRFFGCEVKTDATTYTYYFVEVCEILTSRGNTICIEDFLKNKPHHFYCFFNLGNISREHSLHGEVGCT